MEEVIIRTMSVGAFFINLLFLAFGIHHLRCKSNSRAAPRPASEIVVGSGITDGASVIPWNVPLRGTGAPGFTSRMPVGVVAMADIPRKELFGLARSAA
jgi:hypothetical protein